MYEVELRTLLEDFDSAKEKLDFFAKPVRLNEREVTIFFHNPQKDDFDLRLKLRKNRNFLSFKELSPGNTKKEFESDVSDPGAVYEMLLKSGFKIRMIIPRVKYTYKHGKFEILLNRIIHNIPVLPLIEVETVIDEKGDTKKIEQEIRDFMKNKLNLKNLLDDEKLGEINQEGREMNFDSVSMGDLLDFVSHKKDDLKFSG